LVKPFNAALKKMRDRGDIEKLATTWFTINTTDAEAAAAAATSAPAKRGLNLDFRQIIPEIPYILSGLPVTLLITILSVIFGLIWATVLSLFKISGVKPLEWFAAAYTSIFRGTPLLLQLSMVYFAAPQIIGLDLNPITAGIVTFTLNSGAYMSETIRAGIQAVDRGQKEAAMSLGVPHWQMMGDVVMPQALKNILPALVNETISLLKDSSLVSAITGEELLRKAQIVGAKYYIYFEPLLFAGLIYYILVMLLTFAASTLEKRLRRSD
jgi:polar amino acid transport system substrate-binding protein